MWKDGNAFVERRLSPRIKMTVRRHIAYWVAMSPARRVVASLGVAAIIGGTTFGACRASDISGPNFKSRQQHGISRTLGTSGGLIGDRDSDSDSDMWPKAPSSHDRDSDSDAGRDPTFTQSTQTVLPWREEVFNTCRNEGPITLYGYLKERTFLQTSMDGSMKYQLTQWKDTRGIYGTVTIQEDYYDNYDRSWKKRDRLIRYYNKETLLDKFQAGPMGVPFQTVFQTKMHLEREGADPLRKVYGQGDDLFVFFQQTVKTGRDGIPRTESKLVSECN